MPALIQWQWQVTKPPRPAAPYLSVSPPVKLCGLHLVIVFSYFTDLCLAAPPPYRNLIWLQSNQGDAILPGLSLVSPQQTSSTNSRTYLLQVVCSCHRQLGAAGSLAGCPALPAGPAATVWAAVQTTRQRPMLRSALCSQRCTPALSWVISQCNSIKFGGNVTHAIVWPKIVDINKFCGLGVEIGSKLGCSSSFEMCSSNCFPERCWWLLAYFVLLPFCT